MIPFIDVNVWLYLANPQSPFHLAAKTVLKPHTEDGQAFAVSWQIFYEFVRTATDPRVYLHPVSWEAASDFMTRVFSHPSVQILTETPAHELALRAVLKESGYVRGHFIHDCHIAALLKEHGINTIITADQDFNRFTFLKIIYPSVTKS